jgi:sporulation protein YlmC with PRC-barrel domain
MKRTALLATLAVILALLGPESARGQVAGSTKVGISSAEVRAVALGWSAKKQIIGQTVYNEANQKVGKIDDIIIAPDTTVSFAIVGAGGFVGLGKHDVAIPINQFTEQNGHIVLPGATKDAIKALPKFEYTKKK